MRKLFFAVLVLCFALKITAQGKKYDLVQCLHQNQFETSSAGQIELTASTDMPSVSSTGVAWLKDISFSNGKVEIDLRGKNVFQQSFIGIAFHGKDNASYEVVYFRPFNFRSPDSIRYQHTVQYECMPEFPWDKLRSEHPLVYESAVQPMPAPTDWFHADIIVKNELITVFVNNSKTSSLTVKRLGKLAKGKIGLWANGLKADYANLVIVSED